jgi:hypothetical protein
VEVEEDKISSCAITLIVGSTFVTTFSPWLNVGLYIRVTNFGVTFQNKFEKRDWGFVLRVGATTIIKPIDPFLISLCFVAIHAIQNFI